MSKTKKAAPKRNEKLKLEEVTKPITYNKENSPKTKVPGENKEDRIAKEKAAKEAKKQEEKMMKLAKQSEQVLTLHPFKTLVKFLLFMFVTIFLVLVFGLLATNGDLFGITISIPKIVDAPTEFFTTGVVITFLFMIWMALFQAGWRRVFKIGRWERINKELKKQELKKQKLENKN